MTNRTETKDQERKLKEDIAFIIERLERINSFTGKPLRIKCDDIVNNRPLEPGYFISTHKRTEMRYNPRYQCMMDFKVYYDNKKCCRLSCFPSNKPVQSSLEFSLYAPLTPSTLRLCAKYGNLHEIKEEMMRREKIK